jgi:hypothetical protein
VWRQVPGALRRVPGKRPDSWRMQRPCLIVLCRIGNGLEAWRARWSELWRGRKRIEPSRLSASSYGVSLAAASSCGAWERIQMAGVFDAERNFLAAGDWLWLASKSLRPLEIQRHSGRVNRKSLCRADYARSSVARSLEGASGRFSGPNALHMTMAATTADSANALHTPKMKAAKLDIVLPKPEVPQQD